MILYTTSSNDVTALTLYLNSFLFSSEDNMKIVLWGDDLLRKIETHLYEAVHKSIISILTFIQNFFHEAVHTKRVIKYQLHLNFL